MRYPLIRQILLVGSILVTCTSAGHAQAPANPPNSKPAAYTGVLISFSMMVIGQDTTVPPLMSYPEIGVVMRNSPADSAGLAVGDVIVEINGEDPRHQRPISIVVPELGRAYVLRVRRGDAERDVTVVAAPRPADLPSSQELWRQQRSAARSGT